MAEIRDECWSVRRPVGRVITNKFHDQVYYTGHVRTRHGVVEVYSQAAPHMTFLNVTINGKLHYRSIRGKYYQPRGLVTLADRYATECMQKLRKTK